MKRLIIISSFVWLGLWSASAQRNENNTNISPRATQLLKDASQYLAELPQVAITAEIWREHVNESGEKLPFTRVVEMEVKRPNRLHVDISSSHTQRGFWYDGRSLTILDRLQNLFSTATMPDTLDAALDKAHGDFGVDLPLIDLAVSNPYENATARIQTAKYFGMASAMGFNCHHLAFTQDNVDWQVWIQDGPQPLIRKFVITHKNEPGAPEFTAFIRSWNLTDRIADSNFTFEPPRGALKVEMVKEGEGSGTKPTASLTNPRGQ